MQHREVHVVPAVERQVRHALLVDHTAQRAAGRVDERRLPADHDFLLGHCAYFQRGIHDQFLRYLENQAALHLAPESDEFNSHRVMTHGQCGRPKGAVLAGRDCARQARLFVKDGDAGTGHDRARGVFYYA